MRRYVLTPSCLFVLALAVGCGAQRRPMFEEGAGLRGDDARRRSALALNDIEPRPTLPTTRAVAHDPPPVEALVLYAKARGALMDNQRFTGIKLLERAVQLDAYSPAPHLLLARAYLGNGTFNDRSIAALEAAAGLDPLDTSTHVELGRQYLAKGDVPRALEHLRLAMETPGYATFEDDAALADLFLAKALERGGYDRAAVERYERLLARLQTRDLSLRKDPELAVLVAKPELVAIEIGKLHEKYGRYEQALTALEPAAVVQPKDFDLQARVARLFKAAGRPDDAIGRAKELVTRFRASPASVDLLREVCAGQPRGRDAVAQLRALREIRPKDRTILFALSDTLRAEGRTDEATQLLVDALGQQSAGVEITRRLLAVYEAQGDATAAARLLVETVAQKPDATIELAPLWADLVRPSRPGHLRPVDVAALDVRPTARAARLYFQARTADLVHRPSAAREALRQATLESPPFAPAYRLLHAAIATDAALSADQKNEASRELERRATDGGDAALAKELHGLSLLRNDDARAAAVVLAEAVKLGPDAPDRVLAAARAYDRAGEPRRFEQLLWKLVSDRPTCGDAYDALIAHYLRAGEGAAAVRALSTWLAADPASVPARLLQASVYRQSGQPAAAEQMLLNLVDEEPRNYTVLADLYVHYVAVERVDECVATLESLRARDPANAAAVELLVDLYAEQQRFADAARVIDAARATAPAKAPADADRLYYYAGLYTRIGQQETAEQLLDAAVNLDPSHAGASNDLGYAWADAGRNLDRAEALIRVAVRDDPDNASFLDSLGWVLYKRGKFAEARQHLTQATVSGTDADPIVLDHLGDTLYRLQLTRNAEEAWRQSLDRIAKADPSRDDLKELKLRLLQKLKQSEAGQAVNVAPAAIGAQARSEIQNPKSQDPVTNK